MKPSIDPLAHSNLPARLAQLRQYLTIIRCLIVIVIFYVASALRDRVDVTNRDVPPSFCSGFLFATALWLTSGLVLEFIRHQLTPHSAIK